MSTTPIQTKHAIETLMHSGGQRTYRLYLASRPNRGLIDSPVIERIGTPGAEQYGFLMEFTGKDGKTEVVGDHDAPLPIELLEAMHSERGLTIVNLADDGSILDGQVMWLDEPEPACARPRQR